LAGNRRHRDPSFAGGDVLCARAPALRRPEERDLFTTAKWAMPNRGTGET
jgi:hypothetical protein